MARAAAICYQIYMGFDFHPPLASFPFAFCITVLILEVIQLVRPRPAIESAARVGLVVLAIGIVLAYLSGLTAAESANITFVVPEEAIAAHHSIAKLALFLIGPVLALRALARRARYHRALFGYAYAALLVLICAVVLVTGYRGGGLVFEHGAGVRARP